MTRILTRSDVAAVLTLDDVIGAVERAFRSYGESRVPPPQSLAVPVDGGAFHIKAALVDRLAVKVNGNFPENLRKNGLPTIQGLIVVADPERGTPVAVLDSTLITILRTAAATAVAAKLLARADARVVTVIGCGAQALAQLEAVSRVRTLAKAFAVDVDAEAATRFVTEARSRLPIDVEATSFDDAVAQSDIVVCCTPSRAPLLHLRHLRDGLFIAGVGADNPDKNELAPELLASCRVVPDVLDQAAAFGDLHHALDAGAMTRQDVHGELADVVCGRVPGRRDDREVFVFDSTGTALQDAAAASLAFARAMERGIGLEVAFT